jgi:hypothetical protein
LLSWLYVSVRVKKGSVPLRSWLSTTRTDGRSPVTGYAPGEEFACSRGAFGQIEEWLGSSEAAGLEHAELEEQLAARGRELQRRMLQDHLDLRAARERRRDDVTGPDGSVRARAERGHSRRLSTRFGQVTVTRIAYRAPGKGNVHPADAELNLPPGRHSHGLSQMIARAAAEVSFGAACERVARESGSPLGRRQGQDLAVAAACDFDGFYAGRAGPVVRRQGHRGAAGRDAPGPAA